MYFKHTSTCIEKAPFLLILWGLQPLCSGSYFVTHWLPDVICPGNSISESRKRKLLSVCHHQALSPTSKWVIVQANRIVQSTKNAPEQITIGDWPVRLNRLHRIHLFTLESITSISQSISGGLCKGLAFRIGFLRLERRQCALWLPYTWPWACGVCLVFLHLAICPQNFFPKS